MLGQWDNSLYDKFKDSTPSNCSNTEHEAWIASSVSPQPIRDKHFKETPIDLSIEESCGGDRSWISANQNREGILSNPLHINEFRLLLEGCPEDCNTRHDPFSHWSRGLGFGADGKEKFSSISAKICACFGSAASVKAMAWQMISGSKIYFDSSHSSPTPLICGEVERLRRYKETH